MTNDINTLILDIPYGIKGSCRANRDGSYTIILNARYTAEEQKEAYLHELEHIRNDDFYALESADAIEKVRHDV